MSRICLVLILASAWFCLPDRAVAEFPDELGPIEGRVIWVDFWASWCAPCRRSFPWLNEIHRKYGGAGLQIIGVNVDKERALATSFLDDVPAQFTIRYDPTGALAARFDVQAMPSSFVLDASGNVLARHYGFKLANTEEYEASIRSALDSSNDR